MRLPRYIKAAIIGAACFLLPFTIVAFLAGMAGFHFEQGKRLTRAENDNQNNPAFQQAVQVAAWQWLGLFMCDAFLKYGLNVVIVGAGTGVCFALMTDVAGKKQEPVADKIE